MATTEKRARIGRILVGSLAAGLALAAFLAFAPFVTVDENVFTGVVLLGFASGWALLAGLSTWLSDQPQRWAAAPAVFMGLAGGILLLGPDSLVHGALSWVWPPALLLLAVWMFSRARRALHSRSRAVVLYPVLAVLATAAVGGGYETVSESVDAHTSAMPGRLVDVGHHRLHLDCSGSGGPTVVLVPGAGETASSFGWIAPAVARDTRVCAYDPAGLGWSDAAATPQDGAQVATDLRTLLHRGHVPGPYVLAGHSFGGLYVMSFAAQYPEEVAGMVLVDSTAPTSTPVSPEHAGSYDVLARAATLVSTSARLGLGRVIGLLGYSGLPPRSRDDARTTAATANQIRGTLDEYAVASRSTGEAGALAGLAGKPLIVLTAGRDHDEQWMAAQDKMATLSANSRHRVVAAATHGSLLENRDDATAVSQAIHDVVASVRGSTPLVGP